jgi:hypothetical protein
MNDMITSHTLPEFVGLHLLTQGDTCYQYRIHTLTGNSDLNLYTWGDTYYQYQACIQSHTPGTDRSHIHYFPCNMWTRILDGTGDRYQARILSYTPGIDHQHMYLTNNNLVRELLKKLKTGEGSGGGAFRRLQIRQDVQRGGG